MQSQRDHRRDRKDGTAWQRIFHAAPGFAVNRFFVPWLNEAVRLLGESVADIPTIDAAACEAFGIGIGPFGLINATGAIAYHAAVSLGESLGEFYAPAAGLRKQFESGKPWDTAGAIDAVLGTTALYSTPKKQAVADRLLGVAFGVAAKLVEEGVATMEDTDRGATVGLRWAKGPFAMMNDLGLKRALALAEVIESKWAGFVPQLLRSQRKPWVLCDVRLSIEGSLAIITMSRPDALNALNGKVLYELKEALGAVGKNRNVRAVIITGEGSAFVAGADIKEMQALAEKPAAIRAFINSGQGVLKDIETLPQPVIAAINGFALAVAKAKAALHASQQLSLDEGLAFEVDRVAETFATPDRVEGMQAFVEKRKPVFMGQEAREAGKKRKMRSKK